jgi:hypothetical protein
MLFCALEFQCPLRKFCRSPLHPCGCTLQIALSASPRPLQNHSSTSFASVAALAQRAAPTGPCAPAFGEKRVASGETSQWMADISPNSGAVATVSKLRGSKSRTIPLQPSSLIFPLTQRYSSAVLAPAERHAS